MMLRKLNHDFTNVQKGLETASPSSRSQGSGYNVMVLRERQAKFY